MYDTIAFVDFDGTITTEDSVVGSVRLFTPDDVFLHYSQQLAKGEITLSKVVHLAFESAPSELLPKMLDYVRSVRFRPGFPEFLDEMDRRGIPVVVISGNVRPLVEEKLAPWRDRFLDLYAVDLDVSGPTMKLLPKYDNGDELLAKTEVMKLYDYKHSIGIGDSFTDRNMATAVDTVFARDILAKFLTKIGRPFLPYEDFFDVIRQLPE